MNISKVTEASMRTAAGWGRPRWALRPFPVSMP
jgi:hypothetical protein